ncbi:hypothetical protein [Pontibacillus sp. HMF3514]|uniref:hypothetical protein n=1 Tax=Pontibacillus sp. HMF3514 TaxID=2692425 RepID=UPI00131F99C8|nr:hypothetical protein [Pontibacillus sp. HMF3514]QHE54116.1 hypothetical protein GS400_19740 [Pontibacillus sp. HMF3514]
MVNVNSSVVEVCPVYPDRPAKYFTELFASKTFKIPEQKPDKDEIVKVKHFVELVDVEVIDVFLPDNDTDTPNGKKIFVAGNVYLDVQYVSTREEQTVHFVRYQLPFQTILLRDCAEFADPKENGLIPNDDTIFPDNFVVHVCVENIVEKQLDERTIFFEVLLLVWLEQIEDVGPPPQP